MPMLGAARGRADWMALARAVGADCCSLLVAFALRLPPTLSFVGNDFSVLYVATNSNSTLPLHYRVAAVWGGHEGSMLLWLLMLTLWTLAVAQLQPPPAAPRSRRASSPSWGFCQRRLPAVPAARRRTRSTACLPAAADGRDLNPLLQDPGMVIHPPMLYMGYVGFSVAFSFAVAALIGGNLDATWARWTRPWTTAAWIFLTVGIALGSVWAYYELGWGGWWFWDPVENASFMPWLVGTALIHSLAVTEKRSALQDRGPCCSRSSPSRSRCSAPSSCARACSRRCTRSRPTRARGLFILAFLVDRDRRARSRSTPGARRGRPRRALRACSRARRCCSPTTCCSSSRCGAVLLGTLYPLAARRAWASARSRSARPTSTRVFVPLHDAARLPDGRRPDGALEAGRAARSRARLQAGRAGVRRRRDARSSPWSRAASASSPRRWAC